MTPKQLKFYRVEWSKVRKEILKRGLVHNLKEAEEFRHKTHEDVCGQWISSKLLLPEEFDGVLAKFWSITHPADLNKQLRQLDQHYIRFENKAFWLIRQTGRVDEAYLEDYFKGTCKRIAKADPRDLNARQKRNVIVALNLHRIRTRVKYPCN